VTVRGGPWTVVVVTLVEAGRVIVDRRVLIDTDVWMMVRLNVKY